MNNKLKPNTDQLNPIAVAALRDQVDTFWNKTLAGYKQAAERGTEEDS